jgi:peptidoglycan/xylan/chitin deacetylase (PgdA/CDA1 family)
MYLIKTPSFVKRFFSSLVWSIDTEEKHLYLTFDDGPHPTITPYVLEQLKQYNAKASFFCIGKNVVLHPATYQQIINDGHTVGNHTYNHLNAFKTSSEAYIQNVLAAQQIIKSNLFRPPYGKLTPFTKSLLIKAGFKIIMWDVLSGDFDTKITATVCTQNIILNATKGSIVVLHDSEKAFPRLKETLPAVLDFFSKKGFEFKAL